MFVYKLVCGVGGHRNGSEQRGVGGGGPQSRVVSVGADRLVLKMPVDVIKLMRLVLEFVIFLLTVIEMTQVIAVGGQDRAHNLVQYMIVRPDPAAVDINGLPCVLQCGPSAFLQNIFISFKYKSCSLNVEKFDI